MAAEIGEGTGTFIAEDIGASTADKPREQKTTAEWEWFFSGDDEEFTTRKNTSYRFIPECNTAGLPLLLPLLLKHAEDEKLLSRMSDLDVGALQTHTSFANLILGHCLTERAMVKEHELGECKLELANAQELANTHKQLAQRYKSEVDILASTVQSQDEDQKEVAAALRASEAKVTEELRKTRAEVERLQQLQQNTEDRLQRERAAAATDRATMQAKIAELEGALAKKEKSSGTDAAALQSAIEEHKDSDEYQAELKDARLYGFNLLKKVLIREKKLSLAELNAYNFDDCLLEEDDENAAP